MVNSVDKETLIHDQNYKAVSSENNISKETKDTTKNNGDSYESGDEKTLQWQLMHYNEILKGDTDSATMEDYEKELIQKWTASLSNCKSMDCYVSEDEMKLRNEIYSSSVGADGKIHVSGGPGYEYKAKAYEELMNESMGSSIKMALENGEIGKYDFWEEYNKTFGYYRGYDKKVFDETNGVESIADRKEEAYREWYGDKYGK